jgi:2,4-dienoyl-CoA reductase-like NADH-dependent reductase (Old Yellow Enzyme family)
MIEHSTVEVNGAKLHVARDERPRPRCRGREATSMPVVAVGLITDFEQAEAIVGNGDADFVALARAILYNPRWPWHAAAHLGASVYVPDQYLRSQPRRSPELFKHYEATAS